MKKNDALEGLRGLACLSVVSCHFLYVVFPYLSRVRDPNAAGLSPQWLWQQIATTPPFNLLYNGDFAVILFFVLSGYVLTRKFWQTNERQILIAGALKRYPRLILPASVSIVLALVLMRLGFMQTQALPDGALAGWITGLYVHEPSILAATHAAFVGVPLHADAAALAWNGPLWTMRMELFGSLALFAVFLVFGRWRIGAFAAFAAAAFYVGEPVYFLPFIFGALLNGAGPWLERHSKISGGLFVLGVALGSVSFMPVFDGLRSWIPEYRTPFYTLCIWYVAGAVSMIAGVLGNASIAKRLGGPVGVYVGRISFAMYLLHWPMTFSLGIWALGVLKSFGLHYGAAAWLAYAFTMVSIVGAAHVFHRQVDLRAVRFADWFAGCFVGRRSSAHVERAAAT